MIDPYADHPRTVAMLERQERADAHTAQRAEQAADRERRAVELADAVPADQVPSRAAAARAAKSARRPPVLEQRDG